MRWLDKLIEKRIRAKRKAEIERMFIACKEGIKHLRAKGAEFRSMEMYDLKWLDKEGELPLTFYKNNSGESFGIRWTVAFDADYTLIMPQLAKEKPYYVLYDRRTKEEFVCMYND